MNNNLTSKTQDGLSIVVPVYNEQAVVGQTVRRLMEMAASLGRDNEVILVDDGSTDRTSDVIAEIPGIRVIRHLQNRGYGAALKTGIKESRYDWVLFQIVVEIKRLWRRKSMHTKNKQSSD